jgi:hypothetical protein
MGGSATGGREKVGNSSASVICVSSLRAGVARRSNYQNITVRSAKVFCLRSVGAPACHAFIDWAVQAKGGGTSALPPPPPIAVETGYGPRILEWVEILLDDKARVGITTGFMFLKKDGTPAKAIYFEEALVKKLEWIQQNTSGIIPLTINLWEEFGVRRSMRRGATTEALNAGIDGPTIDANNGWRKVEAAKGKMPRFSMRQRHTQVFQDLRHQLRFFLGV